MPGGKIKLNDTYTLIRKIGAGGGGVVYQAYHERLQTYVVVKQIKEQVKGRIYDRAEVDILKRLKHTYLPRVYDFLEINGNVFTVMDYIPGISLAQALEKNGHFSQKDVFMWAHQLAEALKYLHEQVPPIIHSDIKPANIMLTPEGNICLIDFNISLAFDQGMRTSTGISLGYSPPEQYCNFKFYDEKRQRSQVSGTGLHTKRTQTDNLIANVAGRGVDERSDIYSLGATLYHLLTGVKPSVDYEAVIPITAYDIKLSEGFSTVIKKMMMLDPEYRYQNGGQLLYVLDHIYELDGEYQQYIKRRKGAKYLISALYAAGVLVTGLGWGIMKKETIVAYNREMQQAEKLINEGDFSQAGILLQDVEKEFPHRIRTCEKEMFRLYSMGKYNEVIRYGKDVINNQFNQISNFSEKDSMGNIFYLLGNAYLEEEDNVNAAQCFSKAIKQNQENSIYFCNLAISLAKMGEISQAEDVLREAEELGLGKDLFYMVQGEIAFAKGEDQQAAEYFYSSILAAESIELKQRAVLLCAQAYERLGNTAVDQEIKLLEQAVNEFGLESSMHICEQLADAYARKAQSEDTFASEFYLKALEEFQELYNRGYSTRQMMENIAVLYQQMDQLAEAESMLKQIAEKYPKDYRSYKRLAFLEADKQQKKENEERDYEKMDEFIEKAQFLYEENKAEADIEMQMLEKMREELNEGGWLE